MQAPIDKKNNHYSIAYAFRPGEKVRYSTRPPYAGNAATVKISTIYPGGRLIVVAPPTIQVARASGLAAGGKNRNESVRSRRCSGWDGCCVNLQGTAPPPDAGGGGVIRITKAGMRSREGGEAGVGIQQVPGRLDVLKWPVIIDSPAFSHSEQFCSARKPVVAVTGECRWERVPAAKPDRAKSSIASASRPSPASGATSLAEVDAVIGTSLDALKERLFRLELRHQAGTISEEEYAQERARAEKVLRDLVRG